MILIANIWLSRDRRLLMVGIPVVIIRYMFAFLYPFDSNIACRCQSIELTTTNMYFARARCKSQPAVKTSGLNAHSSKGRAVKFKFLAWSSIAQSVCEWAFSLLTNRCLETSRFESCIQKKTTCLISIRISLACARASKLTTTNLIFNIDSHIQHSASLHQLKFASFTI